MPRSIQFLLLVALASAALAQPTATVFPSVASLTVEIDGIATP